MSQPQTLDINVHSDDFIQSARINSDQQTLQWILDQTRSALAALPPDEKRNYQRLSTEVSKLEEGLNEAMKRFHQTLENDATAHLSQALERHLGRPLDIFRTTLQVTTQERIEHSARLKTSTTQMSLWDAARRNYGFHLSSYWLLGSGEQFHETAEIIEPDQPDGAKELSTLAFVDIVRETDLGARFLTYFDEHFATGIKPRLSEYKRAQLQLALLEALRQGEINLNEFNKLDTTKDQQRYPWDSYELVFGGERALMGLFIGRLTDLPDTPTFSYMPGRPRGEIKRHGSIEGALESIREELRDAALKSHAPWFLRLLSINAKLKLHRFLKTPQVNTGQLNWFALQLFRLFGNDSPYSSRLKIQRSSSANALTTAVYNQAALRFYADALKDYRPVAEADHQTWLDGFSTIVSETAELLLTSAPGGVLGVNQLMLIASFGALGYETFKATVALTQGERNEFIQAIADIVELVISSALQGVGAKLTARRTQALVKALGNPRKNFATGTASEPNLSWLPATPEAQSRDGVSTLNDIELLKKMLSPDLPAFSTDQVERLLPIANIKRDTLDAIWAGTQEAPWPLREAVDGQQLRLRLDNLRSALALSDSNLPEIADQVLPPLLAVKAYARVRIYDMDRTTLVAQYEPVRDSSPATVSPDLVLVRQKRNGYVPFADETANGSLTLLAALLKEHERLNTESTLGKRGDHVLDLAFTDRLEHLRKQLVAEMERQQQALFQALQDDRPRANLDPQHPGIAFSRTAPQASEADSRVNGLLQHFPDLTQTAAVQVLREFPQSRFDPEAIFTSQQMERIEQIRTQSRTRQAFIALEDTRGRGLGNDAESVFCHLLTTLPNWPEGLGLKVFLGVQGTSGLFKGDTSLAQYGDASAERFVELVRTGDTYRSYDSRAENIAAPYPGQNSLVSSVLKALNDSQRDSLGYLIHDSGKLARDIVDVGSELAAYWPALLTYDITSSLSSKRLAGYATGVALNANSIDRDGVYDLNGKHYIEHNGQFYQVLEDEESSTPQRTVWRIVRPTDEVATDDSNRYVSTRPGRSEPVTRDANGQWWAIVVGGAGGGPRLDRNRLSEAQVIAAFTQYDAAINKDYQVIETNSATINKLPENQPLSRDSKLLLAINIRTAERLTETLNKKLAAFEKHLEYFKHNQKQFYFHYCRYLDTIAYSAAAYFTIPPAAQAQYEDNIRGLGEFSARSNLSGLRQIARHAITAIKQKIPAAEAGHQALQKIDTTASAYQGPDNLKALLNDRAKKLTEDIKSDQPPPSALSLRYHLFFRYANLLSVGDPHNPKDPEINRPELLDLLNDTNKALGLVGISTVQPPEKQLILLEHAQGSLEAFIPQWEIWPNNITEEHDKPHIKGVIEIIKDVEKDIRTIIQDIVDTQSGNFFSRGNDTDVDAIDFDFIPDEILKSQTATPKLPRKKIIKIRTPRGDKHVLADERNDNSKEVDVGAEFPGGNSTQSSYHQQADGSWKKTRSSAAPAVNPATQNERAKRLIAQVPSHYDRAEQMIRDRYLPISVCEYLEKQAAKLDDQASELQLTNSADNQALIVSLKNKSQELIDYGNDLLIKAYKNKDTLNIPNLRVLFDQEKVTVKKGEQRIRLRKDDFLDVYRIHDSDNGQPLWEAHFHYPKPSTETHDMSFLRAHLKRLEQAHLGQQAQREQERTGQPVTRIWRELIDQDTARKLFSRLTG